MKIKLDPLKEISKISDTFSFKLEKQKTYDPNLEVSITLRTPISGKEYNIISKPVMTITKTFPPFRGDGVVESVEYPSSNKKITVSDDVLLKPTQKETKQQKNENPRPSKPANKEQIDTSEFSQEELNDPDTPDNLNSVKVLQFKIDQVQSEINKIEGRAPPKLREKLLKFKCRKNFLEQQLGDSISIDDYIVIMNKQLTKDQKLIKYFEQQNNKEQGKKVAERIPILINEIKEAIDFSKTQKKK